MAVTVTEETLDAFVEAFARKICRYYNDWTNFDDVKQEAAAFLLERRHLWSYSRGALFKILKRAAVDSYRKRRGLRRASTVVELTIEPQAKDKEPVDELAARELFDELTHRAIVESGSERWEELIGYHLLGYSANEIGREFRRSPRSVRRILQHFRERLEQLIRKERDDETLWNIFAKRTNE